ncbi:MAG: CDP-alcohol phosphatidyltransferase family protein [Acidimicrobiia bacterium]
MLDRRWRAGVEKGLAPVGKAFQRVGITADALTLVGLLFSIATAVLIAQGRLALGVVGVIATGIPDVLDGTVARYSGQAGPRGAFFDSVCDRLSDALLLGGIAWYLAPSDPHAAVLALAVTALSLTISYERAKADALGFDAKGGLIERAERLILIAVGLAFDVLVPMLWVMLVLSAITVGFRFVKVWRQATPTLGRLTPGWRGVRHARRMRLRADELEGTEPPRRFSRWWEARRPASERWQARSEARLSRRRTRP